MAMAFGPPVNSQNRAYSRTKDWNFRIIGTQKFGQLISALKRSGRFNSNSLNILEACDEIMLDKQLLLP